MKKRVEQILFVHDDEKHKINFLVEKCNLEQWRQAAKWQADSINYMIKEEGVEVVFSHFHGPDMSGHTYMRILKDRDRFGIVDPALNALSGMNK